MSILTVFQFQLILGRVMLVNHSACSTIGGQGSRPSCARLCLPPCRSFFHNKAQQLCILSNAEFEKDNSNLRKAEGWKYFLKTSSTTPCADMQYRQVESVGMCVKFVTVYDNYGHQSALCEAQPRGRVVNLDTSAKIAAIDTIHRAEYKDMKFFIGLTRDRGSDFQWTGGFPVTDAKWAPWELKKKEHDLCVMQASWVDYRWDDVYCTDACGIICEVVF